MGGFTVCVFSDARLGVLTVALLLAGYKFHTPYFSLYDLRAEELNNRVSYINKGLFRNLNKTLEKDSRISVTKTFLASGSRGMCCRGNAYFADFRRTLNKLLEENRLGKRDVTMFVPNEVFNRSIHGYEKRWDYGIFIYAVTGVPLVNALTLDDVYGYGLSDYDAMCRRLSEKDFDKDKACIEHRVSGVIVVQAISPPEISMQTCDHPAS